MSEPGRLRSDGRAPGATVFISYATADRKQALQVCKALERRGVQCWISCRDVEPGDNYQEAIVTAIQQARAMVLVFSDAANNSNEIKKELSLASRFNVTVIALRIEDVEPSNAFAYELSTRQWIDAFESWDNSIDTLVNKLDRSAAPTLATGQPTPPRRRAGAPGNRTKAIVAAAVLALLIAAGAGWWLLRSGAGATHSMQVRLAGFRRLSPELPATLPEALNDEIDAAFNDEGVIGISTAAAPPPGTAPAYALGGTVSHDGDKVKIIVRLTNERSGTTLWSNSFTYDSASVSHVPRWAAVDVSRVVRCGLFGASTYPKAFPDRALSDYLQFCGEESPTKGLDIAHRIVAQLPDFSWGWSALEQSALVSASRQPEGPKRDALIKEGIAAADKAIAIDPSNSEAYSNKSYLIDPNDLIGREALLKKGIAARPLACGCEHHLYGNFLMEVGRVRDALAEYARSTDVLPLNGGTQVEMARALIITGDPDAAAKHFDTVVDLADQPGIHDSLTVTSASLTGKYAGAATAIQNPKFGIPAQNVKALVDAFNALESGNTAERQTAAAEINSLPADWISLPEVPLLAALGDNASALKYTENSIRNGRPDSRTWLWYPSLDAARRDPAFPALLQRVGLIRYWKATHTKPDVCSDKSPPPFCKLI